MTRRVTHPRASRRTGWRLVARQMAPLLRRDGFPDALAEKAKFAALISSLAEDGFVCITTSGMDCDGVQYSGNVVTVPATVVHVNREVQSQADWADGPIYFGYVRPSDAVHVYYESRDRGMGAFENGHAHSIHMRDF
jgi:hypothetical protein